MAISFNQVPSNLAIPIFAVEFNSSNDASTDAELNYNCLIIGQKISAGTQAPNTVVQVFSADQVGTLAGKGSQLHRMAVAWFKANTSTALYIGVLADDGSAVAATGTITFTGTATAAGVLYLYIAGYRVTVAVSLGDTATVQATNVAAAITALTASPVTAASSSGAVTFTARNHGLVGNDLDLRLNYNAGETLPAGVSAAVVAMASGAVNPTLTSLIAAMGDQWFQIVAHPYTDATSLTALETEFVSRAGPLRMIDGACVAFRNDTLSNLGTLGNSRNSPYSVIGCTQNSPTPTFEYAAQAAATIALAAQDDPARPFQTLALPNVLAPALIDQYTNSERNTLLLDGIATTKVGPGNVVQLERMVTTYHTNAAGAPDTTYQDLSTVLTLLYLRYTFRVAFQTKYPRVKLGDDGNAFGVGQAIITPSIAKAEAILWFDDMMDLALVENQEAFEANLVVERDATNRQRLNFLVPPELVSAFIVGAVSFQPSF